jgi:hypothetical protein
MVEAVTLVCFAVGSSTRNAPDTGSSSGRSIVPWRVASSARWSGRMTRRRALVEVERGAAPARSSLLLQADTRRAPATPPHERHVRGRLDIITSRYGRSRAIPPIVPCAASTGVVGRVPYAAGRGARHDDDRILRARHDGDTDGGAPADAASSSWWTHTAEKACVRRGAPGCRAVATPSDVGAADGSSSSATPR